MSYWIKLHDSVLENNVFLHDPTAWRIFEYLCLKAYKGKPQGTTSTTRQQIGTALRINNNTVFSALRRLESMQMVNITGNNRFTTISICKWHDYQGGQQQPQQQPSNNQATTEQHSYKNKIKNKELVSKDTNVETQEGVRLLYDLFVALFHKNPNLYRLTPLRKKKLALRIKQNGLDQVKQAIESTARSDFHTGDNDRGWVADLDFIIRSQEQVEKLASVDERKLKDLKEYV